MARDREWSAHVWGSGIGCLRQPSPGRDYGKRWGLTLAGRTSGVVTGVSCSAGNAVPVREGRLPVRLPAPAECGKPRALCPPVTGRCPQLH